MIGIRFLSDFLTNTYFFYLKGSGFSEDVEKLLRKFVFVFEGKTGGYVTDGTTGVKDFEAGSFGFGDFEEEVFGVIFFNGVGEVFVVLIEF